MKGHFLYKSVLFSLIFETQFSSCLSVVKIFCSKNALPLITIFLVDLFSDEHDKSFQYHGH